MLATVMGFALALKAARLAILVSSASELRRLGLVPMSTLSNPIVGLPLS